MTPRPYLPHLLRTKARTAFGRRITPPFVTLYVTTRCDEKCIHCFYWDELNPKPNRDFTLEEFQRTFASMGEIYNLFIGGGEPFLRPDLGDILLSAAKTNEVANVYVPTNGQHTERVLQIAEQVLTGAPRMRLHLNLSIDHVDPAKHDHIRGKKRGWERMERTIRAIQPLRSRFDNLVVHSLTTLMRENQDDIFDIYEWLLAEVQPDGVSINYCRGNPLDPGQTEVDREIYERLRRRMEADLANGRLRGAGDSGVALVNHLLDQRVRASVDRTVAEQKAQFSCVSGRLAAVIYSDGQVTECETKNSDLGNLRDVDYDFRRLWFNQRAKEVASEAANGCFCTHECGHYASIIYQVSEVTGLISQALSARSGKHLRPD